MDTETNGQTDEELIERGMDLLPQFGRALFQAIGQYHAAIDQRRNGFGRRGPHHGRGTRGGGRGRHRQGSVPGMKVGIYLYRHGPAKVGDIAAWLGVSLPTASEQIDQMVREGLAERRINPDDRREVLVELTPKATELAGYLCELQRAQVRAVLDAFEPAERPTVIRTLEVFSNVLERDPQEVMAEITSAQEG
jgi:DNA-binding MarR family transcriptional regulator